eukprot:6001727-Lingulodinium_polyedra.AAC.1
MSPTSTARSSREATTLNGAPRSKAQAAFPGCKRMENHAAVAGSGLEPVVQPPITTVSPSALASTRKSSPASLRGRR